MVAPLRLAWTSSITFTQLFGLSLAFDIGTQNGFKTKSTRDKLAMKVAPDETWSPPNFDPVVHRRNMFDEIMVLSSFVVPVARPTPSQASESPLLARPSIFEIQDPDTYSAVVYIPPQKKHNSQHPEIESWPLVVLLHGAGTNQHSALYEFTHSGTPTSPAGDHTQLPLFLLSNNQAPASLAENFVVVAPYVGKGKRGSLYDEPRGKVLAFLKWFRRWTEEQYSIIINPQKVSLFGFSEGATLAVELATTRTFHALILASYGFTGTLPTLAIERLQGIPIWVFHSIGDDVYNVECSNRLVESLLSYQSGMDVFSVGDRVKFTQLKPVDRAIVGNTGVSEHVRSVFRASTSEEVFSWLFHQ
ncbi:hypothetical protein HJC23_003150 [Cyclotella cryptica]|uniref:Phospholipase/carboxylesterase/thioesterase domain-containing protein n=1 Tax=Cyclotella cryptica TaxID=29204 RepID=A0ABD3NRG3_9STRA|eukprot:CCRYP_020694-RA/>CCRYP_020694-RA protein AED:0.18 eAED:0.18 QI:0/-1/0/1/-1/1/1/0/359